MAFTAPVTRATDFLVTAAIWNAEHVDNMNTAWPHLVVRKTSDQSVTSSTAFVSDTALQLTVATSEVWLYKFHLRYEAGSTGDIKISFSMPTSGQIDAGVGVGPAGPTGTFQDAQWVSLTTIDGGPNAFAGSGAGAVRTLTIEGTYIGAGTAGTVILRWAQNASDATATKVLTHSTLWAVKLA